MSPLVLGNVAFAALVAIVVWRWRVARAAETGAGPDRLGLRVRARPRDDDLVERCVRRALAEAAFIPTGAGRWADRQGAAARTAEPVMGDRSTLVEVPPDRADAVLAALIGTLLAEGYEVSRSRDPRVALRSGPLRVSVRVDPA